MPSTLKWRGDAQAQAQLETLTPAQVIPGDTCTVIINGKAVSYATAAGTVADTCTGLQAALASAGIAEFGEVSWSDPSNTAVLATAAVAGRPYTLAVSLTPAAVAVPVLAAPTGLSGGSLVSTDTYYYVLTCTNAAGETTPSAQGVYVAVSPNLSAVLTWTAVGGATGYRLYRSLTSGTFGPTTLVAAISGGATVTYTDTGAATTSGTPALTNTALSPATFTLASVRASAGPNDWSTPANWSTGLCPVTGDTVILTGSAVSIWYGLLTGITPAAYIQDASFTGTVGLPTVNLLGYYEYRPTYLTFGSAAVAVTIGQNGGAGSGRTRLNVGTGTATVSVYATAPPLDTGLTALQLQGGNSSSILYAYSGSIGAAVSAGETATFGTVVISYLTTQATDVNFVSGAGATLTTFTTYGGSSQLNGAVTTLAGYAGTLFVLGTGAAGTITLNGATLVWYSSGTITAITVVGPSTMDLTKDSRPKTITTTNLYAGATWLDSNKVATYTNGLSLVNCRLGDVTLDLGENRTIALTA